MKVAILASFYAPDMFGGAEVSTQTLAQALAKSGIEVVVICTRRNVSSREETINGIRVRPVSLANIYYPLPPKPYPFIAKLGWHLLDRNNRLMAARVRRILQEEKPDLLHTQTLPGFSGSAWTAAASLRIPIAHTLRSYYLLCPRETMRKNNHNCDIQCTSCALLTSAKKRQSNLVQGVIGISNSILNKHLSAGYFPQAKSQVIHNPVAPAEPTTGSSDPPRNHSTKPHQKIHLGYLGRLHETKGIEPVLKELRKLPQDSYCLTIAGTGDPHYVERLRNLAAGLSVEFSGHVKPPSFFKSIDFLVVPSLWNEPFGRITIEAFSCGVPVIGSRNGGTAELIDEGRTGFFFDPLEAGSLPSAIQRALTLSAGIEEMRKNVLAESEQYRSGVIADKHIQFYKQIIGLNS